MKAPRVKFLTKIYHANIKTDNGDICLPFNAGQCGEAECYCTAWSPANSAGHIFRGITEILSDPWYDGYWNMDVMEMLKNDKKKYLALAREWTEKYAMND